MILLYILTTIWYMNTILWDYESVWPDVWPQNICRTLWPILHGPVILPDTFKTIQWLNIILRDYESVWLDIWPQNVLGHCDLYFMVHWICLISWRLFDLWTSYFRIMSRYDTTFDLEIKLSLWPIFHGPVILPYILNSVWWMNAILLENESV